MPLPPPLPPSLESLGRRPFSFYPPVLGLEPNEWLFRKATWSEILVANARTGAEVWIPRRFLGEISRVDDPVVIVGLNKELEYKGGAVWPYQRRIIEMPVAVNAPPTVAGPRDDPAPVVGIRVESITDTRMLRLIGATVLMALVTAVAVVALYRGATPRGRVVFTTRDQTYLELSPRDGYHAVVRKLGAPAEDRWRPTGGEIQYRALSYPQRAYTVILMGTERDTATYIGTMDQNWNPVHSVELRGGGDTFSMLRGLKRF